MGEIYAAVLERLRGVGPVHEECRRLFLKSDRQIAQFRPRVRSVQLALLLPERVEDPRIARWMPTGAIRIVHVINLASAEQVDDQLGQWLEESYDFNTD